MDFRVPFGIEHYLRNAGPVAKIDEHDHAVVATALHPSLQDHGLADMRFVQLSASMRSAFHVTLAFVSTTNPLVRRWLLFFFARAHPWRLAGREGVPATDSSTDATRSSTSSAQRIGFPIGQKSELARLQVAERKRSHPDPQELNHRMSDHFQHPLDLMFAPFTDGNLQPGIRLDLPDLLHLRRTRHAVFESAHPAPGF